MNIQAGNKVKRLGTVVGLVILQGCATLTFPVTDSAPSSASYESAEGPSELTLSVTDHRPEDQRAFSTGVIQVKLDSDGSELDILDFLRSNLQAELDARGIATTVTDDSSADLKVNWVQMRNHRATAYSPYVTLSTFSGDLSVDGTVHRIGAFIRRAKVAVWSFDEVVEPTIQQPLDILVKEIAAKINRAAFAHAISDAEVDRLVAKLDSEMDSGPDYLDVYALGFGNNSRAVPHLIRYSESPKEYIRSAAISSLGTLQVGDQFDNLKTIAETARSWADKGMALKSIGDLGTPEAQAYLAGYLDDLEGSNLNSATWSREIISLYLD